MRSYSSLFQFVFTLFLKKLSFYFLVILIARFFLFMMIFLDFIQVLLAETFHHLSLLVSARIGITALKYVLGNIEALPELMTSMNH